MRFHIPGLPFRFDMNGWMLVGCGVTAVGAAGGVAGFLGAWPSSSPYNTISLGVAILGMALYFVGRFVQFAVPLWNWIAGRRGRRP